MNPKMAKAVATPYKYGSLVLAPSWRAGEFDSYATDAPFPFRWNGKLYMTYVGFDGTGYRTGWADSDDGIHWRKLGMVLDRGPAGSITEYNVALTSILRDPELFGSGELLPVGGRYLATWHAYPQAGYEVGQAVIGLAWSSNLTDWELTEPVLYAEMDWERATLYKSSLFIHDGRYYLFYNAKDRTEWPWKEQIGMAWSDDLKVWHKHPDNPLVTVGPAGAPDADFASDPQVFRWDDGFVMFYYGYNMTEDRACDMAAYSRDLVHWEKLAEPLLQPGNAGEIDSHYAHKPGVIATGEQLFHYYCAVAPSEDAAVLRLGSNESRGIALATRLPERK